MPLVYFHDAEWYPVHVVHELADGQVVPTTREAVEVDEETLARWRFALESFVQAQYEIGLRVHREGEKNGQSL